MPLTALCFLMFFLGVLVTLLCEALAILIWVGNSGGAGISEEELNETVSVNADGSFGPTYKFDTTQTTFTLPEKKE